MAVHKPRRLKPGALIGVIAPASSVESRALQAGVAALRAEGFEVEIGASVYEQKGYLAGSADKRAADLDGFFRRDDIDAIFCARGGFGSIQTLPYLAATLKNIRKSLSATAISPFCLTGFTNFVHDHVPCADGGEDFARGLSEQCRKLLWCVLRGEDCGWTLSLDESIRPGIAEAEMMGGCLSLLVTTLGTSYEIDSAR